MKFQNASRQAPVVETLLPLSTIAPEPGRAHRKKPNPRGRRWNT